MGRGGAHAILRERVSHSLLARGHTTHAALTLAPPLTLMMHSQVSLSLSLTLSLSHSLSCSLSLARSLTLSLSPNASGCFTCPWASVAHSVAVCSTPLHFIPHSILLHLYSHKTHILTTLPGHNGTQDMHRNNNQHSIPVTGRRPRGALTHQDADSLLPPRAVVALDLPQHAAHHGALAVRNRVSCV